jgi:hypothetical protein
MNLGLFKYALVTIWVPKWRILEPHFLKNGAYVCSINGF